jgi:serine/threonine protein kinase
MTSAPDQGGRLGKYELVTVLAKSPLGPTWLARSVEPSDGAPIVAAVRRLTLGSALRKADKDLLAQAAVWALSETSEGALNSLDILVTGHELGLVREHAIGQPLRTLLRRCALNAQSVPATVVLRLALDVLETLNATTSKSHRLASGVAVYCGLLGPDFVWITSDGRTLLTEIGTSSALRSVAPYGGLVDLVAYSAPEQLSGTLDDRRSDIFVLGVMLWELLSGGRRLFQGSDPSEVATAVKSAPIAAPPDASSRPSEVATSALGIVMRALDRDLNRRFQSPAEMRQAIADLAPSAVASRQDVAALIAILSGGELAMQEEAVRRALVRASGANVGEAEAREPVSSTPSSSQRGPSSERGAPPASSPPPKPVSSRPSGSQFGSPNGPTSSVPESVAPKTDEVDSAWGEVPASEVDAVVAAEPDRGPRWQMAATALFLALAAVFSIVALMRKPAAREPKSLATAPEVVESAGPVPSAAPSTPASTPVVPGASSAAAVPVPAQAPTSQPWDEHAGASGEGQDADAFAAAVAKRLSESSASARSEPRKKGKVGHVAKTASSVDKPDPLDVLRRLESRRREKKDTKTSGR